MTTRYPETCSKCQGWVWHRSIPCNCGVPDPATDTSLAGRVARLEAERDALLDLAGEMLATIGHHRNYPAFRLHMPLIADALVRWGNRFSKVNRAKHER